MEKVRIYHDEIKGLIGDKLVDEITWDDLEMDQVFSCLNKTKSFVGEQMLYHRLHNLSWKNDEKMQSFLSENKSDRAAIEKGLKAVGKTDGDYNLPKFLINAELFKLENGWLYHVLQLMLVAAIALSFFSESYGMLALIGVVGVNLMVYMMTKLKYEVYIESIAKLKQIYDFSKWLISDEKRAAVFATDEEIRSVKALAKMSKLILNFSNRKHSALTGDITGLMWDYIWGVTLLDVSLFNWIMRIVEDKQGDIFNLYMLVGKVDSELSLLEAKEELPWWCIPNIDDNEKNIRAEELVHPLLANPVSNSITINGKIMLTGANASGKSTFMKAIAINVIMAQTINIVTAKSMSLAPMLVMTCMSLRDDVLSGESYYFREAKYLKRMLDVIDSGEPVFCVIDEILKGTNTTERIAASRAILEHIAETDCLAMVATHDMELTENEDYDKYYFNSKIENGDVVFDYILRRGVGGVSNAIALLELLKYPMDIIKRAKVYKA